MSALRSAAISTRRLLFGCAAAALSLSAISCGGGGGGGVAPPPPVASISVSLANPTVQIGQTTVATATPRDASGNFLAGRAITWSSSAPSVATVSEAGVVTALGIGTAAITAVSEGHTGSATLTVTGPPVASVTVSLGSSTLTTRSTTQATATLKDANGNVLTQRAVSWSSAPDSIASVTQFGFVSGIRPGTATITATSEGQSGFATVTVITVPVASVTVSLASPIIAVGSATQATAVPRDANGNVVSRSTIVTSDNTSVATVTPQGMVLAVGVGTANIVATSDGISGSAPITVAVSAGFGSSAEKVHIVDIGTTYSPTLSGPAAGATTFVSRSKSVATVDAQGVITAVGEGQGWIAASAPGFAPDSLYVIVPRNSTGPLLRSDLTNFNVKAGATTVVNVILDTRSTPIGGAELSVGYTTSPFLFTNVSVVAMGSPPPVITSVQQGVFRVSLASGNPLAGQLVILRFTFTAANGTGPEFPINYSGFLTLTLLDLVSPTGTDLLPVSTSTRFPFLIVQ